MINTIKPRCLINPGFSWTVWFYSDVPRFWFQCIPHSSSKIICFVDVDLGLLVAGCLSCFSSSACPAPPSRAPLLLASARSPWFLASARIWFVSFDWFFWDWLGRVMGNEGNCKAVLCRWLSLFCRGARCAPWSTAGHTSYVAAVCWHGCAHWDNKDYLLVSLCRFGSDPTPLVDILGWENICPCHICS